MSIYQGMKTASLKWTVFKDDSPFEHRRSQEIWNESPIAFAWGDGGLGPAKLAVALLLDQGISEYRVFELYPSFKWDVVALWDKDQEWQITSQEIMDWILEHPVREASHEL